MTIMNNGLFIQNLKIQSYPLTSMYSFKNPDFINKFLDANVLEQDEIIEEIYDEIREGFYTTKYDSVKLICQMNWKRLSETLYEEYSSEKFNYDLNVRIAKKFLYLKDGQLFIDGIKSNNKNMSDEREEGNNYNHKFQWYLLKHLMDADTIIGAFMVDKNFTSVSDLELWSTPIYTTDTLLEKMLSDGVAELHMHVGATKRFSTVWMSLMNWSKNVVKFRKIFSAIKVNTIEEIVFLEPYIKTASIVRILLSNCVSKHENIKDIIKDKQELQYLIERFKNGEKIEKDYEFQGILEGLLKSLNLGYKAVSPDSIEESEAINGSIMFNSILSEDILSYVFEDVYRYDSITKCIHPMYKFNSIILPENVFITKAMEYISDNRKNEKNIDDNKENSEYILFDKLFWQYIKIKNIVYKFIVQQNTVGKGLDIFSNIYKRQNPINISNLIAEAFYSQVAGQTIKKLEIRTTIGDYEKLKGTLRIFFREYKRILGDKQFSSNNNIPSIGIVFNFKKQVEKNNKEKCIQNYYKTNDKRYLNYGELSEEYYTYSKALAQLRSEIPHLDKYIVGIDAASKENETEPFVFKKAYEVLRDSKFTRNISNTKSSFVDTIGFTFHVGEEFRDIISGLRHVDEVIEELEFKAGDRLGHAIVLGIDVDKWAEINQCVYISAGEYLENLLWEWGVYSKDSEYRDNENIALLENNIMDIVEYIFGFSDGIRVRDLYKSYKRKIGECCTLSSKKAKECKLKNFTIRRYVEENKQYNNDKIIGDLDIDEIQWTSTQIYESMHCEYFLRGTKKIVAININSDIVKKYKKLQSYLRKKVSENSIIIETNPTSNLLIGDFVAFEDYHITNLSSPNKEECIVTINTDDPVVFNTRVNNEYALIYDILMRKGSYSGKEIIEWLDKIRKNGLKYSFIKDREVSKDDIIEELNVMIKALK